MMTSAQRWFWMWKCVMTAVVSVVVGSA